MNFLIDFLTIQIPLIHNNLQPLMSESTSNYFKTTKPPLLFSGTSNIALSEAIAAHLSLKLGSINVSSFKDGETNIEISEEILGRNVFIIQSTNSPVNDNLMELLLLISTCKTYGANTITAIIPYFGYSRQDRKMGKTSPVSAALVSHLIKSAGANFVFTVDIHAIHTMSFFEPDVITVNIDTQEFISKEFVNMGLDDPVIISPDAGGVRRARDFKSYLNKHGLPCNDMAIIIKHRTTANQVNDMILVGNVNNRNVIIVDDMIDTAGTLVMAAKYLKDNGALKIVCFATHGLFSPPAIERIETSPIDSVYTTDTINKRFESEKIKVISIAPLIANTINKLLH